MALHVGPRVTVRQCGPAARVYLCDGPMMHGRYQRRIRGLTENNPSSEWPRSLCMLCLPGTGTGEEGFGRCSRRVRAGSSVAILYQLTPCGSSRSRSSNGANIDRSRTVADDKRRAFHSLWTYVPQRQLAPDNWQQLGMHSIDTVMVLLSGVPLGLLSLQANYKAALIYMVCDGSPDW
jgi:hypothetical protein